MEQKVERKPLLSEEELNRIVDEHGKQPKYRDMGLRNLRWAIRRTADHYERMIDRGELVIPKTVQWKDCKWYRGSERGNSWHRMACCGYRNEVIEPSPRCPGCGARIVE